MGETMSEMRKLFILLTLFFCSFSTFAQFRLGIFGGVANYQGDLTDKAYKSSKGAFGVTLGYEVSRHVILRAGLTFAKVAGADSLSKSQSLKDRNLSFQSPVTELSFLGEFTTFDMDSKRWSPYVFAGLSIYHFNPYTFDQGNNKVYLKPLSTEGEGLPGYANRPYALTQLAIPLGGGIKFALNDNVQIGLEVGLRKLFTDHLDDVSGNYPDASDLLAARGQKAVELSYRGDEVPGGSQFFPAKGSQRGSPNSKDYYYFTGLHLSFRLNGGGSGSYYSSKKKGYGCPASPI